MLEGPCQLLVYDGASFMRVSHPDLKHGGCDALTDQSSVSFGMPKAVSPTLDASTGERRRRRSLQLAIGPGPAREESAQGAGTKDDEAAAACKPETKLYIVDGARAFLRTAHGPARDLDLPAPIALAGREADPEADSNGDVSRMLCTYTVPLGAAGPDPDADGDEPTSAYDKPGWIVEVRTDRI
jgi:hypothetical protein